MMQSNNTSQLQDNIQAEVLSLIKVLVGEIHPHLRLEKQVDIDSDFEQDLGLDSLARAELLLRVEKHFDLTLPENTFAQVESARDLIRAIKTKPMPRVSLARPSETAALSHVDMLPKDAQTLVDVLNWHADAYPERKHIQVYSDKGDGEIISYSRLRESAYRVAFFLQQQGLKPAEPVAIMLPTSTAYFYSFFGILFAGGIPVPIYPPARLSQLEDHLLRHARILSNCGSRIFITVPEAKRVAQLLKAQVSGLQHIVSTDDLLSSPPATSVPVINALDIAFIQYTSGSTGDPKGVMLSHANLLSNIRAMGHAVNAGPKDVFVSWLPLYHDMGLIGSWLGSLYHAALFVVMSPLSFLARPERWLWAIHRHKGTLSASPNFGYEYCLKRIQDEDIKGLNLASWRAAFNGAEPVSPQTMQNFCQRFEPYGFHEQAMMPVFGLAESSVGLTFPPLNRGPLIDCIEREYFSRQGIARPASADEKNVLRFISSGSPLLRHQIRIVDRAGHELPDRHEGHLQFQGPSSTSGYYRDSQKTGLLFDGQWLNTGDLGYISDGELFVTGRNKDIIIKAGRNIYPHELEDAVGNLDGIRTGRVVVFGSQDKKNATEQLIVVAETHSEKESEKDQLRKAINAISLDLIGLPPDQVLLSPPGYILKTSSGKIRRTATRDLFEKGVSKKHGKNVFWQVVRIGLHSIKPQIRRLWRYSKSLLYAVYSWTIYLFLAPIVWLATMFIPSFKIRWAVMRFCTRLFAKSTRTQIEVNGLQNIPPASQPFVLASNHASYLDSYVLVAAIPGHLRFIAKKELAEKFYNRIPLRNIGTLFVDRQKISKTTEAIRLFSESLQNGDRLIFFAEGTFTRIPGLRPFRSGAFISAADANVPVIPVAIRGTRSILRPGSWFPHHGSVHIEIGEAIDPREMRTKETEDTWHIAMHLSDVSRKFILQHCGEPDLSNRLLEK